MADSEEEMLAELQRMQREKGAGGAKAKRPAPKAANAAKKAKASTRPEDIEQVMKHMERLPPKEKVAECMRRRSSRYIRSTIAIL